MDSMILELFNRILQVNMSGMLFCFSQQSALYVSFRLAYLSQAGVCFTRQLSFPSTAYAVLFYSRQGRLIYQTVLFFWYFIASNGMPGFWQVQITIIAYNNFIRWKHNLFSLTSIQVTPVKITCRTGLFITPLLQRLICGHCPKGNSKISACKRYLR